MTDPGIFERVQKRIFEEDVEFNFDGFFANGWKIFKKVTLYVALASLILSGIVICMVVVSLPFLLGITSFDELSRLSSPGYVRYLKSSPLMSLKTAGISVLVAIVMAPLQGGILKICRDADKGEVNFGKLFAYFQAPYFLRLSMAAVIITATNSLLGFFWQYLGIIGVLLNYTTLLLVSVFTIYVSPLIVFGKATISEAINLSVTLVYRNFFPVLGIVLLFGLLSLSGIIICGIGILFTVAFSFIGNYMLYKHAVGFPEDDIADGEKPHWLETAPPTE